VKREETLPTYTRQNPVKRATNRLTGRFPLKISKPLLWCDGAIHPHLAGTDAGRGITEDVALLKETG
jgi:hypothetical protein